MQKLGSVLLDALALGIIGALLAFGANALSPRGLQISRNYFPGGEQKRATTVSNGAKASATDVTARLQQRGLQAVSRDEVVSLFHDPAYQQGSVIFVDARNDAAYQSGHIPAAWQFDHYRAENYLPAVLPVALGAQKVVVYCNGGECEDSEFAAITLRDAGVPPQNIYIYVAGITDWKAQQLPIEHGAKDSGDIRR